MRGLRLHVDVGERVPAALVRRRVVTPRSSEQVDHLVETLAAVVERRVQRFVLLLRPPDADADGEPSVAEEVETRQRVRERERARVLRPDEHARAETDAVGDGGRERERHQRVAQHGRGVRLTFRDHEVVAHPHVVVPERLGVLRRPFDATSHHGAPELRKVNAEGGHGVSLRERTRSS